MEKNCKRLKPFWYKNRYYNHKNDRLEGLPGTLSTFFRSLFGRKKRLPAHLESWIVEPDPISCSVAPLVTWIGHATFLIQVGGINIITDPIFGNASLLYNRILPPGIPAAKLPNIDYVLLSHNHRDHMDEASLLLLKDHIGIDFLVPKGDKSWFDRRGFERVKEYTWWDQESFSKNQTGSVPISFTFLPSFHWSQRGFFDKNRSLWGSWMIECNDSLIYFAGDTAYTDHFAAISKEFNLIDSALLPIGPCEPDQKMRHSHMSAQQAGQAFLDLNAQYLVPMHWATFHFGVDHFETPILQLQDWWKKNSMCLQNKGLQICKIGEGIIFDLPK